MSQHSFASETSPSLSNLDGNFNDIYPVINRFNVSGLGSFTLDSAGNFLSSQTTTGYGTTVGCSLEGSSGRFIGNHASGAASGSLYVGLAYAGSQIGSITQNGTTGVAYNTSSDYRLKDDPQPVTGSGSFIDALQPCTWTWKSDGSRGIGFIAHELQAVSPSSVTGAKDAMQAVGNISNVAGDLVAAGVSRPSGLDAGLTWTQTGTAPVYQGVEYGSAEVIAMLVAEVKALRARVHALDGN